MHVRTAVKLSFSSLAQSMKLQPPSLWFQKCVFFCFARGAKEKVFAIDFNKDEFQGHQGFIQTIFLKKTFLLLDGQASCSVLGAWCKNTVLVRDILCTAVGQTVLVLLCRKSSTYLRGCRDRQCCLPGSSSARHKCPWAPVTPWHPLCQKGLF